MPDRAEAARTTLERVLPSSAKPWLLVYDNLESEKLLRDWSPRENARILVTTRVQPLSAALTGVPIDLWPRQESIAFLRAEANRNDLAETDLDALANDLGDLPLALSHAAAYLRDNVVVGAARYRERLAHHMTCVPEGLEEQRSVFATYQTAIHTIERKHPGAAAIMRLAANLASDDIPLELFTQAPDLYRDELGNLARDERRLDEALSALARLSLIRYAPDPRTFSVHRLVQSAVRAQCGIEEFAAAIRLLNATFPAGKFEHSFQCTRLIDHVRHLLTRSGIDQAIKSVPDELARLWNESAHYLMANADFSNAQYFYWNALEMDERRYSPHDPRLVVRLSNLANALKATSPVSAVEPLYRRALEISRNTYGIHHPATATVLDGLAGLIAENPARLKEARALARRALKIDCASKEVSQSTIATRLNNMGYILKLLARLRGAELMFRLALRIDETNLGSSHPNVARDLSNLASVLRSIGRLSEAEALWKRALELKRKSYGFHHPEVATMLNNLAVVLKDRGHLEEAECLYKQALDIDESKRGDTHPLVALRLYNLAGVLYAKHQFNEAHKMCLRAARIARAKLPADHPDIKLYAHAAVKSAQRANHTRRELIQIAAELNVELDAPDGGKGTTHRL